MNLSRVDNIYLSVNNFYLQEVTNYIKKIKKKKKTNVENETSPCPIALQKIFVKYFLFMPLPMAIMKSKINQLLIYFQSGCTSTHSSNFYYKYGTNISLMNIIKTKIFNKMEDDIFKNWLILYIK